MHFTPIHPSLFLTKCTYAAIINSKILKRDEIYEKLCSSIDFELQKSYPNITV